MKIKIKCKTPKGKAEASMKSFIATFSLINRPIETKIVDPENYYLIYNVSKPKEMEDIIYKKIPKCKRVIKDTYTNIIWIVDRGNEVGKKFQWNADKIKRHMIRMLDKKFESSETSWKDFVDTLELTDKEDILKFLAADDYIEYEILNGV